MNWDQIERKWAAMARRVRADWAGATSDDASEAPPVHDSATISHAGIAALAEATPEKAIERAVE